MVSIGTDLSSLILQNTLGYATEGMNKAMGNMTTGYRINSAKDDAAGYFVATGLESKISSWLVAKSNTENGMALLDTAEGGLENVSAILQRLRDLSVQAAEGVYDANARAAMQAEADQLIAQMNQIKDSTQYNGLKLYGEEKTSGGVVTRFARTLSSATVMIDGKKVNSIATTGLGTKGGTVTNKTSYSSASYKPPDRGSTTENLPQDSGELLTLESYSAMLASASATGEITGAVDFAAGETKTVIVDGVSYTVKNRQSVASSISYIKDTATGQVTFLANSFDIRGQNGVSHDLMINGKSNYIYGGDMDDKITTYNGQSTQNYLYGGDGNDIIIMNGTYNYGYGQGGNDTITVNGDASRAYGGDGDDILNINRAVHNFAYKFEGGAGNDTFNIKYSNANVFGNDGDDIFNVISGSANVIDGGSGNNSITDNGTGTIKVNVPGANTIGLYFTSGETKTEVINGISYTIKNNTTSDNALYYSIDNGGVINFKKGSGFAITGDVNVAHNIKFALYSSIFKGGNIVDRIAITGGESSSIYGLDGDDIITNTGCAYANIYGGDGNDNITTSTLSQIFGEAGNDIIKSTYGDYVYIDGGIGDDEITMSSATKNSSVYGGAGNNTIINSGTDNFINGFGAADNAQAVTVAANGTQNITINGISYSIQNRLGIEQTLLYKYNSVTGEISFNGRLFTVRGEADKQHNAVLYGRDMIFYGGNLDDTIKSYCRNGVGYGQGGNDTFIGASRWGSFYGGDGDDNFITSGGSYSCYGQAGNDTITVNSNVSAEYTINGGEGDDTYNINASCTPTDSSGNNIYNINTNNITVTGGQGDDTFYVAGINNTVKGAGGDDYFVIDGVGNNIIDGGTGNNYYVDNSGGSAHLVNVTSDPNSGVLRFSSVGETQTFTIAGKTYTVRNQNASGSSPANNQLKYSFNPTTGQITVNGSDFTITSDATSANLAVRGDNNTINGSDLADRIIVESGSNNIVNGLNGNDTLISNSENNSLIGGAGNDTITINASTNKEVSGGDGDDIININSDNNTNINTGSGNDKVTGTTSSNVINVSSGDNNVLITGGNNRITALDGDNHLSAVGNNNTVISGNGSNTIGVQGDNNTVNSGSGNDTFILDGNSNTVSTTAGSNSISVTGNQNNYQGGSGKDNITVKGDRNTVKGGADNDDFLILSGDQNNVDGEAGNRNILKDKGTNTIFSNVLNVYIEPFKLNLKVGIGSSADSYIAGEIALDLIGFSVDLSTEDSALASIDMIDMVMASVTEQLTSIGALKNRLESVMESQDITLNNLISAKSTIKDADIAKESVDFIRYQILQQATVSLMSASRNFRAENVLSIINSINQ